MAAPRLMPDRKIPRELTRFSELSKFLSENKIKLFSKEEYTKYDMINYFFEQASTDDAFYIIDLGEIVEQYKKWEILLPRVKPFYAVKSCSDPLVLQILSVLGCGFSCTSKTEIISVTDQNVSADRIIYTNPIKDSKSIKFARSQDVDYLAFDNETELFKIKLYHPYAKLIIRINPNDSLTYSKFGCPISEVKSLLEKAKALELNVIGVTFHVESKPTDVKAYKSAIQVSREVFKVADSLNMRMYLLDIGSGFPGSDKHALLKFEDIAHVINAAIDEYFSDIEGLKVIAEPGRYFSTKSHTLLFNVIGKRSVAEADGDIYYHYYMNDGIYGSFRCIMFEGATPEICAYNRRNNQNYKSTLFGPTGQPMDIIARNLELPELGIGDWCYVEDFGAYTQSYGYNSNDRTMSESNYIFMY